MAKIDREAAKSWNERGKDADYGAMVALDRAGNELAKLPAEEDRPAFRWIPLSERLPERSGKYLVTVKNGNVYAGTFSAYEMAFTCAATAWMPLPDPWEGEEHE